MTFQSAARGSRAVPTFSFLRAGIVAVVVAAHALWLMLLTVPPAPVVRSSRAPRSVRDNALEVRLLAEPKSAPPPRAAPRRPPPRTRPSLHARPKTVVRRAVHRSVAPASTPLAARLTVAPEPQAPAKRYVAGGQLFQRGLRAARAPQRKLLPDNLVPHAARFAMRDPRTEGVAGLLHRVAGWFGAVDPACKDVNRYRGMSDRQRAGHGVTGASVEALAAAHGCHMPGHTPSAPFKGAGAFE